MYNGQFGTYLAIGVIVIALLFVGVGFVLGALL